MKVLADSEERIHEALDAIGLPPRIRCRGARPRGA